MNKLLGGMLLCLLSFFVSAETAVPALTSHFNDLAQTVAPHERAGIDAKLADFEKETSNQLVILTVPTIGDETLFSFSQRVFESWKLGQKGKDNGVLVLFVKEKKKKKAFRIHTGRGLEGAIPDITCTRIIVDFMRPLILEGKASAGFNAGIDKLIAATKGEYKPAKSDVPTNTSKSDISGLVLFCTVAIFVFVVLSSVSIILGIVSMMCASYLLVPDSVTGMGVMLVLIIVFFVSWLVAWFIHTAVGSSGGSSSGGYFSSDSSSGGGFSSGGFSGGGGDSAGGGGEG